MCFTSSGASVNAGKRDEREAALKKKKGALNQGKGAAFMQSLYPICSGYKQNGVSWHLHLNKEVFQLETNSEFQSLH